MTPFEELGGEGALRALIDDFIDRVYDDAMIGFFFRRVPKEHIKEKEYEHAAQWLGADVKYTGRPIAIAHQRHSIMGGQFARRLQILRETLADHHVPLEIARAWIEHQESLRHEVTPDRGSACNDPSPRGR